MFKLYKKIEDFWFKFPQKIRYLLVGGFNTVAAYVIFSALFLSTDRYIASVILQYIISINISILTMRYYVFQSKGSFAKEYMKAGGVYVYMLGFNILWLHFFIEVMQINALISQAFYIIVSTIATYILHKHYSFKKK
jgi:putative flippase GtrA